MNKITVCHVILDKYESKQKSWWIIISFMFLKLGRNWKYPLIFIHLYFSLIYTKSKLNSFFSSALDSGLLKKAKDILNNHAFGTEAVKGVSQDYNKPLFIPAFSDSIQAIVGQSTGDSGRVSLDMWKHQYTTHFPQSVRTHTTIYRFDSRYKTIFLKWLAQDLVF